MALQSHEGTTPTDRLLTRRDIGRVAAAFATAAAAGRARVLDAAAPGTAPATAGVAAERGGIRIGSNENPHGLGPAAQAAVREALAEANRYPFETAYTLGATLAASHDVGGGSILLTPGSGEILRTATVAFTSPSLALVAASPTYEAPGRTAESLGATVRAVPVLASGSLDLAGMAAQAAGAGLFFVCNPNNPTGGVSSSEAITEFVARVRRAAPEAVILVDEAYHDYVEDPGYATAVPMTRTDRRLVVSRTFSKIYGMAGLRVGYAVGHPETLAAMRRVTSQGTLTNVSAAAALAAFTDRAHHAEERALNREAKAFTRKAFEDAGFTVMASETNFVMIDVRRDVSGFAGACREQGVFIARPFPPLTTHARVSIGTIEEMRRAVPAMLAILSAQPSARRVAAVAPPDGYGWVGC